MATVNIPVTTGGETVAYQIGIILTATGKIYTALPTTDPKTTKMLLAYVRTNSIQEAIRAGLITEITGPTPQAGFQG